MPRSDGVEQQDDLPELALFTLTPQNKQHLFHDAIEFAAESTKTTEATLARLKQLDPSVAQQFGFKNAATSEAPFRLLSDAPTLMQAMNALKRMVGKAGGRKDGSNYMSTTSTSHTKFSSYIALSYCWHNEDWTPAPTCRELGGWPIAPIMLRGLLNLRQSLDEGIWIDSCCIDQSNENEKMLAIGSMDVIYRSARLVVVILEDVYLLNADADLISTLLARGTKEEPTLDDSSMPHGIRQIMSSRWFTRAWCSQEYQVSGDTIFLVPSENGLVLLNIQLMQTLDAMHQRAYPNYVGGLDFVQSLAFQTLYKSNTFRSYKRYGRTPMAQFHGVIHLDSSIWTDKIGIALNVTGLQLYFVGPQMSSHQCYWVLFLLALSAGDLTALCGTGPRIQPNAEANGPSWIRWFIGGEDFVASLSEPTLPRRLPILSMDSEHITLDLLVLQHYTLDIASKNSILAVTTFLDELSQEVRRKLHLNATHQPPQIEILACCLDCGLAWLVECINFNQDVADQMQQYINEFDFDFWSLVVNLLTAAYPSEKSTISGLTDEQKRSLLQYMYFTFSELNYMKMCSLYHSGVFASGQSGSRERCIRLDWKGPYGKALTYIGAAGKISEYCLAVPVILSGSSCATMDRLWLLKPRSGPTDTEWRIVEKIKFLTLVPLEEDGENVVFRAAQTIRARQEHGSNPSIEHILQANATLRERIPEIWFDEYRW